MYWNSSTGESGPAEMALKPSERGCFLVMRRSLFLMAATILSSEPWWVLIEYKWQPGTKRRRMGWERAGGILDMCCAVGVVPWHHPTDRCFHKQLASHHQQWKRPSLRSRYPASGWVRVFYVLSNINKLVKHHLHLNIKLQMHGNSSWCSLFRFDFKNLKNKSGKWFSKHLFRGNYL